MQTSRSTSDISDKLKEMEENIIRDMEARQAQREAEIEEWMMRQMQELQLQHFTCIMQIMTSGTAGRSHRPELLPSQMADMMTNIMKQYIDALSTTNRSMRKSPPPREQDNL